MPKELTTSPNTFFSAAIKYRTIIGREPYQSLENLLSKIKDLWISNTQVSQTS